MNMKMKNILIALLTASVAASASAVADNQKALQAQADSANAKRGVEIGGSIRAVAQRSSFSTDQDKTGINSMPDVERNEFVTADLNFGFRPYESVRANVLMRLGGGMQEYFAAASKTLEAKWLNVEGNVGKNFYWIVGDFRSAISPLSIYRPGIDIMYEPTIFARKRHMAEKEQLLEGNQRNLQGVNLQFRQEIDPMIGEVRAEAIFARLNRVSVLDFSGAEGNILPNSKSYTYRHPDPSSFNPDDPEGTGAYEFQDINPFVSFPQKTFVLSIRAGVDAGALIKVPGLSLDLVAEYALSSNKVPSYAEDPATGDAIEGPEESVSGSALLVNLNAGYKVENSWSAGLSLDFIRNDEKWFNNLAQSPSFFAQRILNSDKDGNTVKYGVNSPLYSTFDALYNYSPKFTPVARSLGTDDNAFIEGQSNSYNIAPYNKNSWGNNVYSAEQLALINMMADPALQLALPNGLATANRMGVRALIKGDWQEKVEAQALVTIMNQVKSEFEAVDKVSYMEFGGGAKADIAKIAGLSKSAEFAGSFKHSESKTDLLSGESGKVTSDFINVGASFQFLPRLGVTAGFQMINTDYGVFANPYGEFVGVDVPLMKSKQMHWMVGFDYLVGDNAWLAINYGMINVTNDYNTAGLEGTARNLPDYFNKEKKGDGADGTYQHKFSQSIFEASINVEF